MTPLNESADRHQPDQRIWPDHQRAPGPLAKLRAALAGPTKAAANAFASLATPPGVITTPDGIQYKPLARTTLAKALAPTGPGSLDFVVTFPSPPSPRTSPMRIRATAERRFADLLQTDPPLAWLINAAKAVVRPGDRVLILGAGTGYITAQLAEHVGPSGAVTAFEADAQSVAFARARYPLPNAAHERDRPTALAAEPAAAAESIIVTPDAAPPDPLGLWSRLATPGRILIAPPHTEAANALAAMPGAKISATTTPSPNGTLSHAVLAEKRPAGVASHP